MKTALITGASAGIGKAFAQELASRKMNLFLVARSEDALQTLAETLQNQHQIKVDILAQDLTEPGATQKVYDTTIQRGISVDLLVNNAGFGDYGTFSERPLDKQIAMIQLNIVALVELTHLFLKTMRERRSGSIINLGSIASFEPIPYLSVYAASKAFVLNFTEALWAENKESGVKFLALCPGPTETNFFQRAEFPESKKKQNEQMGSSPEKVVKEALEALEEGRSSVVAGGIPNQMIANAPRFLPREVLVQAVEKQFRNS